MRTQTFNILTLGRCVAKYPEDVCFAFNPNFVEIESEWKTATLTVEVAELRGNTTANKQSIKVSMRDGKVRIYLSRLFELLFENPRLHRSIEVWVNIKVGSIALFNFETIVIWGNLAVCERFGAYGVYDHTSGKQYFERTLIWFKNFPFNVSLFQYNTDVTYLGRYDGNSYKELPIYTQDKWKEFDEIDIYTPSLPELTDITLTNAKIIYFALVNKFIAKEGTVYSDKWEADSSNNVGDNSFYSDDKNGKKPRKDITYLLRSENGFYRYQFLQGKLINLGLFSLRGFINISPSLFFNEAKNVAKIRYTIGNASVFDFTFDKTFFQRMDNVAIVNLKVSNETAGHYLRWIDRQGNLQYFLFTKGRISHKNKLGTDLLPDDFDVNGTYFANHLRTRSLDCSVTMKCCAVNLSKEIFDYVVSILSAPIVDLYCGKDALGEEIWLPVNIQTSTVDYAPTRMLNDMELSFNIPDINSQSL